MKYYSICYRLDDKESNAVVVSAENYGTNIEEAFLLKQRIKLISYDCFYPGEMKDAELEIIWLDFEHVIYMKELWEEDEEGKVI